MASGQEMWLPGASPKAVRTEGGNGGKPSQKCPVGPNKNTSKSTERRRQKAPITLVGVGRSGAESGRVMLGANKEPSSWELADITHGL